MPGFGGLLGRLNPLHFLKPPNGMDDAAKNIGGAAVRPPEGGIGSVLSRALPENAQPPAAAVPTPLSPATAPDFSGLPRNSGAAPMMAPTTLPGSAPTPKMVQAMNRASYGGSTPIEQARNEYALERPPAPGLKGRFIEAMKSAGTGFLQGAASHPENPLGAGIGGAIAGGIGGAARPDMAAEYRFNALEKPRMEADENRAMQLGMERAKISHLEGQTAHDAAMLDLQRQQYGTMQENLKRDNDRADWQTFEIQDPDTGLPFTVRHNVRTGERQIIGRSGRLLNQQIISAGNNQTKRDVAKTANQTKAEIAAERERNRRELAGKAEAGKNARAATMNRLKEQALAAKRKTGSSTGGSKTITEAEIQRRYGPQADKAREMLRSQGYTIQ